MIRIECDICGKTVKSIDTVVLYKRSFDYCSGCTEKVKKIMDNFRKEMISEYNFLDVVLRGKENKVLKKIKNEKRKEI